ncbi:MAG: prohibitin family protein [Oscillospiraceae bacterium]
MADNNTYNAAPSGSAGKTVGKIVTAVIVIFVVLIVVFNTFTTVDAGHTGVVTTFGKVSPNVLSEGLHTKIPFIQDIIQIDNRVLKAEVECSSASKDLQTVSSTIALNYRVRNESSADIYQNVGLDYESIIIAPAIHECVKAVTAKFTAEELITSRQAISDQMKEQLSEKISSYGIEVQIFNIISFDFTAEYNAAIEAKQTAQQNALKAEQDLQRVKVEAEQTVAKAQAEAEAYRLKSQELTPQMILMEYIDKWDGKLPSMVSGEGTSAMIDVTSLLEQFEEEQSSKGGSSSESTYTAPAVTTEAAPAAEPAEDEEVSE